MNEFPSLENARELDAQDPLAKFRDQFHIPTEQGKQDVYLVGNSLGLQPKRTADFLNLELETWQKLGVRGHFSEPRPWLSYHDLLTKPMADLVGAHVDEVITMNTLTVNLHLMMATFYRPTASRHKILIEAHAFPSDKNATESQLRLHGFDPADGLIEIQPDDGELFSSEAICDAIRTHRDSLALILLPGVQYYTGQVFDMKAIAAMAREFEIPIGFDLAHAAGNIPMSLHEWEIDFACWCSYKYLNSGPGSISGCFIHRRHASNTQLPRMAGWWGHDEATRFQMTGEFAAMATAEGWQLSNPPILSLAAIRASLEVFQEAGGIENLRAKSIRQGDFFRQLLETRLGDRVQAIAPADCSGCQLSLEVKIGSNSGAVFTDTEASGNRAGRRVHDALEAAGCRTDWREPNVIRAAPVPLYNSFEDIWHFVDQLGNHI